MTEPIVKALSLILDEKCYIDCFGGLVRKVTMTFTSQDGKKTYGTYPVSCEKLDECKPGQPYTELLPSNKYKSVSYVELLTPPKLVNRKLDALYPKGNACSWTANFRFVMSYNMKRLGYNQCSIADKIITDIMSCFKGSHEIDDPYKIPDVTFSPVSFLANDPVTFGKYSYEDALLTIGTPPCEYFHIDFSATWTVLDGCISQIPFTCLTEIPC